MSPIVTVTFSPCIDRSANVPSVIPDRKLKCSQPKLEPGGGGINVARAIRKLGGESMAIYPSGGYTGMHFNKLLAGEGVPSVIVETISETRENIIILDETANRQYRFGMPGTPLEEKEWKQILHSVEEINTSFIVASGSLPPGVPQDIFGRLAVIARKKNARLVVDTPGDPLRLAIEEGVFLIKPNLGELAYLVKREHLSENEIGSLARQLTANGKVEVVVVSMGAGGALLVTNEIEVQIAAPTAKRQSTVGAGDSMVAGMIFYLSQGRPVLDAAMYGVASGTAATMNPGTELCKKEDADRLYQQVLSKQPAT